MTDLRTKTEGLAAFLDQEDGAVTVDWVVLAAAVVLLALPITSLIGSAVNSSASSIADTVIDATD